MTQAVINALAGSVERAPWGWALLLIALLTLIKVWPIINQQVLEAKKQIRSERREDAATNSQRIEALEAKVESLTNQAQSYQMKLVSALAAFRLLAGEIEKSDPKNPVLKQANDLIGMASSGDMGMGKVMDELSRIPAVKGKA